MSGMLVAGSVTNQRYEAMAKIATVWDASRHWGPMTSGSTVGTRRLTAANGTRPTAAMPPTVLMTRCEIGLPAAYWRDRRWLVTSPTASATTLLGPETKALAREYHPAGTAPNASVTVANGICWFSVRSTSDTASAPSVCL